MCQTQTAIHSLSYLIKGWRYSTANVFRCHQRGLIYAVNDRFAETACSERASDVHTTERVQLGSERKITRTHNCMHHYFCIVTKKKIDMFLLCQDVGQEQDTVAFSS